MALVDVEDVETYANIYGFLKHEDMLDEFEEEYGELPNSSIEDKVEIFSKIDSDLEGIAHLIKEYWDGYYLVDWDSTETHILVYELNHSRTAILNDKTSMELTKGQLIKHFGHDIEIARYGNNLSLECTECHEVITDTDNAEA